jgi:hypothetical protein
MGTAADKLRSLRSRSVQAPVPPPAKSEVVSRLDAKVTFARSEQGEELRYAEITRIIGLPVNFTLTPEEYEAVCKDNQLAESHRSGFRLLHTQAQAILEFQQARGLFAPIGVGWGKTLISLLCAHHAYTALGIRKIVLSAPSSVMPQLLGHDLAWARCRVPLGFPVHVLHDRSSAMRRQITKSGQPGVYIFPHSLMSTKDCIENLERIDPGYIILDEAHAFKEKRAARTKRLFGPDGFVTQRRPLGTVLSGTITRKSINDYHHLIRWCLGDNSPLPHSVSMAMDWAGVIDADAQDYQESGATGPLRPLVNWARAADPAGRYPETRTGFRRAYKLRLMTCPGVVASGDAEIGVSLVLKNTPVPRPDEVEGWGELQGLIDTVEEAWLTPNGDEIEYGIHKFKWLYELSAGFYNLLTWPEPEILAARREIHLPEAQDLLDRAKDHHEASQCYAKRLRQYLQYESERGLDTPLLVGANMAAHKDRDLPNDLYQLWREMHACDFEGRPERDRSAVRVCPYKIHAAVGWSQSIPKGKGGIIWVYHQEVGRWAYEAAAEAGLDALHCPSGRASDEAIIDSRNKGKVVIASMSAHGTGKNLQHFQHQYFLQWPRPAGDAEQVLGRTHRTGQEADELVVVSNHTTTFDDMNLAACINDALYIHQTTGSRQKLILATYNPLPKMFPPEALLERGIKAAVLDREQTRLLHERFGSEKGPEKGEER